MRCFACGQAANRQCPRCGRWFCPQHGKGQCDRCRAPASLPPSTLLFRSAVVLLVLSLGLAGWHLVAWPGSLFLPSASQASPSSLSPEESFFAQTESPSAGATATPSSTPPPTTTPATGDTPVAIATPSPTATPTATPTPQARRYTVEAGDTLSDIAARFNTTVAALIQANNIEDPTLIRVGQELVLP